MIQKEHILGVLIAVIAITGVQIATQMQMQKITKQVEMVQSNLSANVKGVFTEEKISSEDFTQEELVQVDQLLEDAYMNSQNEGSRYLTLWNRIRRKICRDTGGVWTGDPINDCDRDSLPTNPSTETHE